MSAPLHVIILAAGQGSRMKSKRPKVLHCLAGRPLLHHVIEAAEGLSPAGIHVVIGHGADEVRAATPNQGIQWVMQNEQLGTGHAVDQALPGIPDQARVLVLYGDVPLTSISTLARLVEVVDDNTMALLTVDMQDPSGYGRILRGDSGEVHAIVEEKDASDTQKAIREVNTGLLAATGGRLKDWLPTLSSDNAQGEYYLTDIIALAANSGLRVDVAQPRDPEEVQGVNNRLQLAALERWYQRAQVEQLMLGGVTMPDPSRVDVRGKVQAGQDVFLDINVVLEGEVTLADDVVIGPNVILRDCALGSGTVVEANSVIDGARIAEHARIGPFARLRPGTVLAEGAKVGNFVETKKASLGPGSKVNHLSYVGDATLEGQVNIGAGTITCNYDGVNKHHTRIGAGAFVGSNTSLVAPVTLGTESTVGAGSTITRDVSDGELAVARGKQRNISGWRRPSRDSEPTG